jgi:predicted esterase YcpF (UPF0227 family)
MIGCSLPWRPVEAGGSLSNRTLIYLHGFRSSPASVKATQLRDAVAALPAASRPTLHIPELQCAPERAIALVAKLITGSTGGVTLVGSSLGGYYATYLAERHGTLAVLINPAVRPYVDLQVYLGIQTNLYTGEPFEVTSAHFDELRALRVERLSAPANFFLLLETGDEVLDYRDAVALYGGAWQYVRGGGDHAFQDYERQLPAILRFAGVAG